MGCGSSSATAVENSNAPVNFKALQKKSKLPMNLIKQIYEKVQKVDSDGKLKSSQFVKLLATSDDEDLKRFLKQLFNAFNVDNNGTMDFEELTMMLSVIIRGSVMERLKVVFQICDEDKSGKIEKKELVNTFKNMTFLVKEEGVWKSDMEEIASSLFDATDKDGNGHLTQDEFVEGFFREKKIKLGILAIFDAISETLKEGFKQSSGETEQ